MITKKQFNMRLTPKMRNQIRWCADFYGVTMTQVIEDGLRLYLFKHKGASRVVNGEIKRFDDL
jgi:hypothetical protein